MSIAFAEYETATQSERFVPHLPGIQSTLLHCLIISEAAERREFFEAAAQGAGWQVTACADAAAAKHMANRFRHALVIVDLDGVEPSNANGMRALAERLSTDAGRLLMVCGSDGNPLEEIWARQLGVWLYLAGVDLTCDVESLCSEARHMADQWALPVKQAYARTA
jgi:hypothetical protein